MTTLQKKLKIFRISEKETFEILKLKIQKEWRKQNEYKNVCNSLKCATYTRTHLPLWKNMMEFRFFSFECVQNRKCEKKCGTKKIMKMTTTTIKIVLKCKQSFADTIENSACYFTWNLVEGNERENLYLIVKVWYFKLRFKRNAGKLQKCVCVWRVMCMCVFVEC